MASVFNPKNCTIPDVPPIEDMPVLVDCDIPFAPDPITDCPDIDLPIPAILGWMGFECVGGEFGPPGPDGTPGPAGPGGPPGPPGAGCIKVLTKTVCVKKKKKVRVEVFTFVFRGCTYLRFIFYVLCPKRDKEVCCWWKYCPAYELPGDPADALFQCIHGEDDGNGDDYDSPYEGNGGPSGDNCPWVLMTRSANDCEDCTQGPCSTELIGAYAGQVEIWCDCAEVDYLDCPSCGACYLPNEIEAYIDMYYEYRAEYKDADGKDQVCWVTSGIGGGVCKPVTLVREHQDEEGDHCWSAELKIPKFQDFQEDIPIPGELDDGGVSCGTAVADGMLCATIRWCCNAGVDGENDDDPEMTVEIEGQIIPLTGLAEANALVICDLAGGGCTEDAINNNGWIQSCLRDCDGAEIPVDDNAGCVWWCHSYDRELENVNTVFVDVPICGSDETRKIRIWQFGMSISCQCCDPDDVN